MHAWVFVVMCACMQGLEVDLPEEGADTPAGLERMSDWVLDFPRINIGTLEYEDCAAQFIKTLQQLASLRTAPGVPVRLRDWPWTEPMAQALAQARPTLGHLNLYVFGALTDDNLGMLLHMGECGSAACREGKHTLCRRLPHARACIRLASGLSACLDQQFPVHVTDPCKQHALHALVPSLALFARSCVCMCVAVHCAGPVNVWAEAGVWDPCVELQSEQHANVPWPWRDVNVNLEPRVVRCETLRLGTDEELSEVGRLHTDTKNTDKHIQTHIRLVLDPCTRGAGRTH